jgi:hypothetical protein
MPQQSTIGDVMPTPERGHRIPPVVQLATLLLLTGAATASAQVHRPTSPVASTVARDHDYQTLVGSARALYAQLATQKGLTAATLTAKLAPVRTSLTAWAARYHVKLNTHRVPATRLAGTGPIASTKQVTVEIPHGGTATCPMEWASTGVPCGITDAQIVNNTLICVYDCPDTLNP